MQTGEVRNPIVVYILTVVTCGIYGIIWFFKVCEEINGALGREEFNAVKELLLTIVTCGLWGLWLMWRMSEAVVEVEQTFGAEPKFDPPIVFVIALMGFSTLVIQLSLNNAWEQGGAAV